MMCDMTFVGFAMPQLPMLASYADALRRGWSPNTLRDVSAEQLAEIAASPTSFLDGLHDAAPVDAKNIVLPDGREMPRLPMRIRWIWDGEFSGSINLRWQPGTDDLPPHVLGHIGYAVVPWKQGHGLAKRALRHMLGEAREVGLKRVTLSTDADNIASQKVITANGGRLVDEFVAPDYGPALRHRYAINIG